MHVGGNTWSQMVTEAFNSLQLAPRALFLLDLSFLNKMRPSWGITIIFCKEYM